MAETTGTLSALLHSFYHKTFLESAEKKLYLKKFAVMKDHPKGMGVDSFVTRMGHIPAATSEISEGVTPAANTVDVNKYTVSLKQYGTYVPLTDKLIKSSIDPILEDLVKKMGYAAGRDIDTVVRDSLITDATAQIAYASSASSNNTLTAGMVVTAPEVVKVVRQFAAQDAPKFDDDHYVWIIHPYNEWDVRTDTSAGGFIELGKYTQDRTPMTGEIGKCYGAKVVVSSNIYSVANSGPLNVYYTMVLAKDGYVMTKWNKDTTELIIEDQNSGGVANPLHLLGTVAWKAEFGIKYVGGTFSGAQGASPDLVGFLRGLATGG